MNKFIHFTATVISFYILFPAASNVHSKEYTTDVEKTVVKIHCLGGQDETSGTGFVFDITQKNAFILTANHVVTGKDEEFSCENIQVEFTGHLDTYKATIYRSFDQFDIAIVRLKQFPSSTGILKLGNSQDVDEGSIYIYGYPGGADGHKDYGRISNKSANKIILDDITPAEGISGSPLIYEKTNDVIGVIIQKAKNPKDQYALEIDQVKLLLKNIKIFANLFPVIQHTPPKAPTDLRAAMTGQKTVRLQWADNADNETGFKIMRRVGGENQFREYATVRENQNIYLDQHADRPGTDYQYMIQAFNDVGKSLPSNMASVKIPLTNPQAPADLRAQAVAPTQVKLEWKDRADNERGFKIERRAGTEGGFRVIDTVGQNQESFYDKRLRPGAKYEYRVRTFNDGGESGYSNPVSIRMDNPSWATASGFLAMAKPGRQFVDEISGLKICGSQRSLDYLRKSTGVKDFTPIALAVVPDAYLALEKGVCDALVVYMDDPKKLQQFYYGMRYNEVAPHFILLP